MEVREFDTSEILVWDIIDSSEEEAILVIMSEGELTFWKQIYEKKGEK